MIAWQTPCTTFTNPFEYASTVQLPHQGSNLCHGSGYFHARTNSGNFNHHVEDLVYTAVSGASMTDATSLGISSSTTYPSIGSTVSHYSSPRHSFSAQSTFNDASNRSRERSYTQPTPPTPSIAGLPPILQSQTLAPKAIAPYPSGQQARQPKRLREADPYEAGRPTQRRRSTSTCLSQAQIGAQIIERKQQVDLTEEEQLLFTLKQEGNLPWKDISREFEQRFGRTYQVPALQMRFKRLKERLRTWTENDVCDFPFRMSLGLLHSD